MHYDVDRDMLDGLALQIKELATIRRKSVVLKKQHADLQAKRCHLQKADK